MNGKMLQPEQRQQMIDTIKILTDASQTQYMHAVQPIPEQADMEGVPHSMILSGALAEKSTTNTESKGTRVFKSKQAPGSVVTVQSGKKYKIGADGVTGTEI